MRRPLENLRVGSLGLRVNKRCLLFLRAGIALIHLGVPRCACAEIYQGAPPLTPAFFEFGRGVIQGGENMGKTYAK